MITAKATEKDKNEEAGDAHRGGVARAEACAQVGVEMRPEVTTGRNCIVQSEACAQVGVEMRPEVMEQLHRPVGSSQGAREGPDPGLSGACRPLGRNTGGWRGWLGLLTLGEGLGTGCHLMMPFNPTTADCGQAHQ